MEKIQVLDSLKYFVAAAKHLNFTHAAKDLGISQSAISQQIAKLETIVGFRLFDRQARGLKLTEKGEKFWTATREGLGRIDQTLMDLDDSTLSGKLTVRTLPSFAARWLAPRIIELHEWAPELNIVVDADLVMPDFLHDGVDIAITYGKGDHPEWDQTFLFNDAIFPVCSPDFLEKHIITSPKDLRGKYLLHDSVPQAIYSTSWDAWFSHIGTLMPQAETGPAFNTMAMVCESAIKGQGVALTRYSLVADDLANNRLVRLFDHVIFEDGFYLACPKSRLKRVVMQKFYEWTKSQALSYRKNMENLLNT